MRSLKMLLVTLSIVSTASAADSFTCKYNLAGAEGNYEAQAKIFAVGTECFNKLETQFTSIDREKKMDCHYSVAGNRGYSMETHTVTDIPEQTSKRDERVSFDECKRMVLDNLSNHFEISYEGKSLIVLVEHLAMETQIKVGKDSKPLSMSIEKVE